MVFLPYDFTNIFLILVGTIETMVTSLLLMSEKLSQMTMIYSTFKTVQKCIIQFVNLFISIVHI